MADRRPVAPPTPDLDQGLAAPVVDLGRLALAFGRVDRITHHEDGTTPESDTDHTVMLGLVACAFAARHLPDLDLGRVAQYALAHDLVEVYAGDIPTLRITAAGQAGKHDRERAALERIEREFAARFPWVADTIRRYEQWHNVGAPDDPEARYVRALDKLLPKITHLLDGGVTLRQQGMGREELGARLAVQGTVLLGYASDFPPLLELRAELVGMVLAGLDKPAERPSEARAEGLEQAIEAATRVLLEHHSSSHGGYDAVFGVADDLAAAAVEAAWPHAEGVVVNARAKVDRQRAANAKMQNQVDSARGTAKHEVRRCREAETSAAELHEHLRRTKAGLHTALHWATQHAPHSEVEADELEGCQIALDLARAALDTDPPTRGRQVLAKMERLKAEAGYVCPECGETIDRERGERSVVAFSTSYHVHEACGSDTDRTGVNLLERVSAYTKLLRNENERLKGEFGICLQPGCLRCDAHPGCGYCPEHEGAEHPEASLGVDLDQPTARPAAEEASR